MEEVSIRPAQSGDIDTIYKYICELEEEKLDKNTFEKIFNENLTRDDIYYFVAEYSGKVAGFMSVYTQKLLHHNGTVAEIQELFIDSHARSKGIGKKLIEYARDIADKNNCKMFEVTCNVKRKDTHKFYEREGLLKSHYKFTQSTG